MTTAVVEVVPIVLKDCLLVIGATGEYQKHVSGVEFVPATSPIQWKGLSPSAVFTDIGAATWTCNLSFAQDWVTPDSLSQFLFDHEGETLPCVFEPKLGGPGFTANFVVTPGSIGGAVDSVAVSTVALGVSGRPVLVP